MRGRSGKTVILFYQNIDTRRYGGPNSQKIKDRYLVDWSKTLITRKDVIYAYIDGRGSGRQSDDLKFQVYRRLGTVEIHDQIYGAA